MTMTGDDIAAYLGWCPECERWTFAAVCPHCDSQVCPDCDADLLDAPLGEPE